MMQDMISFYISSIVLIISALGIIFAPRMYLSLFSFVLLVVVSSFLFYSLNAHYVAIFQLILCGIFLCGYIFILLKKIGRLNLKNKLVPVFKRILAGIVLCSFSVLVIWFFKEDFSNSLFNIFNFVTDKTEGNMDFSTHYFSLQLILLLVFVSLIVIRVFLLSAQNSSLSSDGCALKKDTEEESAND